MNNTRCVCIRPSALIYIAINFYDRSIVVQIILNDINVGWCVRIYRQLVLAYQPHWLWDRWEEKSNHVAIIFMSCAFVLSLSLIVWLSLSVGTIQRLPLLMWHPSIVWRFLSLFRAYIHTYTHDLYPSFHSSYSFSHSFIHTIRVLLSRLHLTSSSSR